MPGTSWGRLFGEKWGVVLALGAEWWAMEQKLQQGAQLVTQAGGVTPAPHQHSSVG